MRKLVLICLCMAAITTASAQIRWGVKAGANMSKLMLEEDGESFDGNKLGWGFHGGLVMEYAFGTSGFAIQPELLFLQGNSKIEFGEGKNAYDSKYAMNYLQLPINAKYSFGLEKLKLFVLAGTYLSYGLSGKWDDGEDSFDPYKKYDGDDSAVMKRFDLGVGAGIGVELSHFTFTISDQFGLLNTSDYGDDSSIKANSVLFSLGYFF